VRSPDLQIASQTIFPSPATVRQHRHRLKRFGLFLRLARDPNSPDAWRFSALHCTQNVGKYIAYCRGAMLRGRSDYAQISSGRALRHFGNVTDNGSLAFDRSDPVTFAGAISGTGALVQSGSGTLTLTGNNTYTGNTTISAGMLQIGNGGTSGSITGNVTDNGSLAFDRSDSVSFGGVVTGSGALAQLGSGTLILTGNNTFTGGTTISAGTPRIGNGGATGSITGNVTDNGTLAFDRSDSVTFEGAIRGTGALVQLGSGVLTLTGTNTYSGGTTISAGTLQVGNGGTTGSIIGMLSTTVRSPLTAPTRSALAGSYSSSRSALGGMASGGTEGAEFSTFISGGYDFYCGHLSIGPIATLQYTYVSIDSFSENGSLAPLDIHTQSADSLRSDFGFRASYLWQAGKVLVEPSLRAAWEHEYKYSDLPITAGFAGIPGPSATFFGPSEGHDSAIVSAGVSVQWTPAIATYVNYDGQLGRDRYDSNAVTGGVRISF